MASGSNEHRGKEPAFSSIPTSVISQIPLSAVSILSQVKATPEAIAQTLKMSLQAAPPEVKKPRKGQVGRPPNKNKIPKGERDSAAAAGSGPVRTSQRQIKRPKADDEIIDFDSSSRTGTAKKVKTSAGKTTSTVSKTTPTQKKPPKPKFSSAAKDLGRWRPTDDLMLISAVLQTNDLSAVHIGVKFSCRFTLREIEQRWYALLYEPQISKLAIDAIRGLHPGVVTMTLNNALWSQEEEALLAKIPSTDPGRLETFQKLLANNPAVFHPCRSATSLHHHWVLMGHYSLLHDQHVDVVPPSDSVVNFSDAEDLLNDTELMKAQDPREEALEQELMLADKRSKREILALEQELPSWTELLELPNHPTFEPGVFLILKGRVVQYMMRASEVTLGRASATNQVTFDLSLEGPAFKISRKQATIRQGTDGGYFITNDGRRPLYLNGTAVITGESAQLQHNHVLEVGTFSLLILINSDATSVK